MIRWSLNKAMSFVLYRPKLASSCVKILASFPLVNDKLISFANNEGLITHDHGPVPKEKKSKSNQNNVDKLLRGFDDRRLPPLANQQQFNTIEAKPSGKNHAHKSPLEKWFY